VRVKRLVNMAHTREFILAYSKRCGRRHTRVAQEIYDLLDAKIRELARQYVDVSPGMTVALTTQKRSKSES